MATPFLQQRYSAQSAGIAIVRKILETNSFPNGFTTKQLYQIAVQEPAPADFKPYPLGPPTPVKALKPKPVRKRPAVAVIRPVSYPTHPDHPIRSVRFLKEYILPFLQGTRELKMTSQPKTKSETATEEPKPTKKRGDHSVEWVWKVVPLSERAALPPPKVKKVVGTEVGVGQDVSHLNKRRQRTRVGKVSREVQKLKEYKKFNDVREPLMERLESNSEILEKVSQALDRSPKTGLDAVVSAEKKAKRTEPRRAPFTPIAGPLLRAKLEEARKLAAYPNQPREATV